MLLEYHLIMPILKLKFDRFSGLLFIINPRSGKLELQNSFWGGSRKAVIKYCLEGSHILFTTAKGMAYLPFSCGI